MDIDRWGKLWWGAGGWLVSHLTGNKEFKALLSVQRHLTRFASPHG